MKKQIACISGMNGFLGGALHTALKQIGYEVIGITREQLQNAADLQAFFLETMPDVIFHLAAYGNNSYQTDEAQNVISNIYYTFNVLEASKNIPYKALVFTSSSSVYGKKDMPMKETMQIEPRSFYAATKAGAEHLITAYASTYDKPCVSVRLASVYGPGEADFRFIPRLCHSLQTGEEMKVAPDPTHSWIYVTDAVRQLLLVADSVTLLKGEVVNISNGTMWTNDDIIQKIEAIAKKKLLRSSDPYAEPTYHSSMWLVDNTKIKELGYKQTVSIEEGLSRTYEYYKKNHTI